MVKLMQGKVLVGDTMLELSSATYLKKERETTLIELKMSAHLMASKIARLEAVNFSQLHQCKNVICVAIIASRIFFSPAN